MTQEKCRVAYRFSNEEDAEKRFQSIVNQLEQLVVGRTGVFEKHSGSMDTVALVLYFMPLYDRPGEDIKDYMDKNFIENMISKKTKVVVVFLRTYGADPSHMTQLKLPKTCKWVEVIYTLDHNDHQNKILNEEEDPTKEAITTLREMIEEVCPHHDNDIIPFSMMIMMMV